MKKIISIFIGLLIVSAGAFIHARNENQRIPFNELPPKTQQFIKTHFGKNSNIAYAEKKWYSYEVYLSDGFEIDFDSNGLWDEIESKHKEIPASIVKTLPQPISDYLSANYKGWILIELKKKTYGYKLELDSPDHRSDVELEFSHKGELLKVDY